MPNGSTSGLAGTNKRTFQCLPLAQIREPHCSKQGRKKKDIKKGNFGIMDDHAETTLENNEGPLYISVGVL